MEIFGEFVVVDEKPLPALIFFYLSGHSNNSTFRDVTQFATLEFNDNQRQHVFTIADIGTVFDESENVPLAQFVRWAWDEKGEQVISETKMLNIGGKLEFDISSEYLKPLSSLVVRILKKRETTDQNPCLPLSSPDDDLTVQIGENEITVSAHWLMSVSPVIQRMLSVEMREKQQRLITLDELGVDMELFMEFLENISLKALHKPILPNPKNVLMLLKLADYFQIDWLKLRCDMHLINCVEIPLIDRFLLIEKYGLDNLKNYFSSMNVDTLRAFFKANRERFLASAAVFSIQFFADLIIQLSG